MLVARQNDHLYTYFITWWEEVRRGACDETGDPKFSFSVFATDRRTTYTRSRSTVGGSPVRRLRRERDIHKYPLAGKRLRLFQTVRTWHVSSSRWFRRPNGTTPMVLPSNGTVGSKFYLIHLLPSFVLCYLCVLKAWGDVSNFDY
ncbi:hypothetical protein M5K25_010702 [Dendrobium thyrsiflorum]|uniref:Uncharacterized protein n=1 Tax=Dendrobium thyrsiflorum TaxID=117978 RepID=A0ABD0V0A8_DENTH